MRERRALELPVSTFVRLSIFAFIVFAVLRLWPLIIMFILASLLAIALEPVLQWSERHMRRSFGILSVALLIGLLFALIVGLIIPPVSEQITNVAHQAPSYIDHIFEHLPASPAIQKMREKLISHPDQIGILPSISQLVLAGQMLFGGLASAILIYVLSIYLLIDGPRTWEWLIAFSKPETRQRFEQTAEEVSPVVSAYVLGQLITSVICAVYIFALCSILNIPAALMLGVLAGLFDVLPILGFIITLVPALIFALTVSPVTALILLLAFVVYHMIENYWLVPWIYGNRLRLSGLTVLVSFLAALTVFGILGAIAILPIVASYPIVERIWLSRYLGREVVRTHQEIESV
jgi:predicted PurR-regulated permease PerM